MGQRKIHVQAHRGACSEFAENTLPAFRRAVELGVDSIELDVQLTDDGDVVVFHDFEITPEWCRDNLGNPIRTSRPLWEVKTRDLQSLEIRVDRRLANKRALIDLEKKIPTLKQVFEGVRGWDSEFVRKTILDIEIKRQDLIEKKAPSAKEMASRVVSEIKQYWNVEQSVIRSFDFSVLDEARQIAPEISRAVLTYQSKLPLIEIYQRFRPTIWAPHFKDLTPDNVQQARELGLEVIPYTVNAVRDFEAMVALGVTGLTTDDPTLLLQFLRH